MTLPTVRQTYVLVLASTIGLMGYALYTQYFEYLEPCPLCMTQRVFYVLVGLFALIALIHTRGHRIYAVLGTLSAIGGASVAGRQVWLQHLPADRVPACGPSLQYMLEMFPLGKTLEALLSGDGNCAEIDWTFLGFSMAEWSLVCFIGLIVVLSWQATRKS